MGSPAWFDRSTSTNQATSRRRPWQSRRRHRGIRFLYVWRKRAAREKEGLIEKLQKTLAEVKTLRGILPLCSYCKKVRDDKGYWEAVDVYIRRYSEADVSHGICPECVKEHFPEFDS